MGIDIHMDGTYKLSFWRKSYKKARWKKKADRLVWAFFDNDCGASALITDGQYFKVKHIAGFKPY